MIVVSGNLTIYAGASKTLSVNLARSAAGGAALGDLGLAGSLLLGQALLHKGSVSSSISLGLLETSQLSLGSLSLSVNGDRGHQSLNLGSLGNGGGLLALGLGEGAGDNNLADIIGLGQVEKLADLVSSLRTKSVGDGDIRETLDLVVTLLDDNQSQGSQIGADNATTNGFSLSDGSTLANTARSGSVTRSALSKEEANTSAGHDTLSHGETILVGTTRDLEDLKEKVKSKG